MNIFSFLNLTPATVADISAELQAQHTFRIARFQVQPGNETGCTMDLAECLGDRGWEQFPAYFYLAMQAVEAIIEAEHGTTIQEAFPDYTDRKRAVIRTLRELEADEEANIMEQGALDEFVPEVLEWWASGKQWIDSRAPLYEREPIEMN